MAPSKYSGAKLLTAPPLGALEMVLNIWLKFDDVLKGVLKLRV
jgi:hypothetical protein